MQPSGCVGGLERGHALGQQRPDKARQNIARPRRRQGRRRIHGNGRASIRSRHHRIGPLVQHHAARQLCRGASGFQFADLILLFGQIGEQTGKFTAMRRQHPFAIAGVDGLEQRLGISLENVQRIGIQHDVLVGLQHRQNLFAGAFHNPRSRPHHHRRTALVG